VLPAHRDAHPAGAARPDGRADGVRDHSQAEHDLLCRAGAGHRRWADRGARHTRWSAGMAGRLSQDLHEPVSAGSQRASEGKERSRQVRKGGCYKDITQHTHKTSRGACAPAP